MLHNHPRLLLRRSFAAPPLSPPVVTRRTRRCADVAVRIALRLRAGYFQSMNCMRELIASTIKQKPIVAIVDPIKAKGGLSVGEVHAQLVEAEGSYGKWGFDAHTTPRAQALFDHLFAHDTIEWNRAQ